MIHTQGNWTVGHTDRNTNNIKISSQQNTIGYATCKDWGYEDCGISKEETQANARLFAAAPELLAALEYLIDGNEKGMGLSAMQVRFDIARNTIKKAKGE